MYLTDNLLPFWTPESRALNCIAYLQVVPEPLVSAEK
jgi:hypothetical protein